MNILVRIFILGLFVFLYSCVSTKQFNETDNKLNNCTKEEEEEKERGRGKRREEKERKEKTKTGKRKGERREK